MGLIGGTKVCKAVLTFEVPPGVADEAFKGAIIAAVAVGLNVAGTLRSMDVMVQDARPNLT